MNLYLYLSIITIVCNCILIIYTIYGIYSCIY